MICKQVCSLEWSRVRLLTKPFHQLKFTVWPVCKLLQEWYATFLLYSLIQFFNKMKKWSDMAGLPQEFIDKVNKLERNFAVSTVIFKKYEPIFLDLFQHSVDYQQKQNRNKKQRCVSSSVLPHICFNLTQWCVIGL